MSRPIIQIKTTKSDYILEGVALLALILLIALPIIYYQQLPDIIPNHFNANGKADRFGSKAVIWLFPTIGAVLYFSLTAMKRVPHKFNYPVAIDEENAYYQYKHAVKLVRVIKLIMIMVMLFITYKTIAFGLGDKVGIGVYFLPLFLGMVFLVLGTYVFKAVRNKRIDDHLR